MSNVTEQPAPNETMMTPTEAAVAQLWRDLLNLPEVDTKDDFFKIGGTSLLAIKLLQRVEKQFGPDSLTPDALYEDPRLSSVARAIDEKPGR